MPIYATSGVWAQEASTSLLTLVLDGFSSAKSYEVLKAFLDRGLPVGALLDGKAGTIAAFPPDLARYDGLLEVLAPAPDVAYRPRFAQARGAAEQRKTLIQMLPPSISAVGLFNRNGHAGLDVPAFRSAGFRVMMNPDGSKDAHITSVGRRQVDIWGGVTVDTDQTAPSLVHQFDGLLAPGRSLVAVLPLDGIEGPRGSEIIARIFRLADHLETKIADGLLVMLRPMDHLLLSAINPARATTVVLEVDQATLPAAKQVIARADESGIPLTVAGSNEILETLGRADDCLALSGTNGVGAPVLAKCVVVSDQDQMSDLGASEIVLRRGASSAHVSQIDQDGRLHTTLTPWETLVSRSKVLADPAVLIATSDYATAQQRETIFRTLQSEGLSGKAWFLGTQDWANHLMAPDPLYTRFLGARRRRVTDPLIAAGKPLSLRERDVFIEDAKAAWAYIANQTVAETGLAVTTVQTGTDGNGLGQIVNADATLWDLGSQIQGILAAAAIGLIPLQDRDDRIAKLLAHIPVITIDGVNLPPSIFTVRRLTAARRDFDICDLGRFLLALDNAVAAGALTQENADTLTQSWDIGAAIREERLHSFRSGEWIDITASHCTDYIIPAFRRRGFTVRNIYPEWTGAGDVDEKMAALATAAFAGAIGVEPLLLDVVEGGQSEVAALLADVLFDAQLGWFEKTGKYRSPSEVPINRPPWFVYQGLYLDRDGANAWAVNSIDRSSQFQTDEFRKEAEVIVAKSAYLWRAARPHPYSDTLTDFIRDNCRVAGKGFNVGVFAENYDPLEGYFDINTNGIILSALAYLLD